MKIAFARHPSGKKAVQACCDSLGEVEPALLMAFVGGKHRPKIILTALRKAYGDDVPIVGGSVVGTIARNETRSSGFEIGLVAFIGHDVTPSITRVGGLDKNVTSAGDKLGARIATLATDGAVVLLLYDSVASQAPRALHPGSALLDGLYRGLGDKSVRVIGGGMLADIDLTDSWLYNGESTVKHEAVALVFPPQVGVETVILHGCRPLSGPFEITRIAEAEVHELDGEPALDVIERVLNLRYRKETVQTFLALALGRARGKSFESKSERDYVNRLVLEVKPETRSVVLFEEDFQQGDLVQIMFCDSALMLQSAARGVEAINKRVAGQDVLLALYIDCAGRASFSAGAPVDEADPVRTQLAAGIDLAGFYSGVEIAPIGPRSRPLDWTGVLTVLYRRP